MFSSYKNIAIVLVALSMPILAEAPAPAPLSPEQRIEILTVVSARLAAENEALKAQMRLQAANERMVQTLSKYRRDGWRLNDSLEWEKEK